MGCHDCSSGKRNETCMVHNPTHARICKRCCIERFKGFKCSWWNICWE